MDVTLYQVELTLVWSTHLKRKPLLNIHSVIRPASFLKPDTWMCFLMDVGAKQPLRRRHRLEALSCALFLDCAGGSLDMVSLGEIAFWSLEGGDTFSCPEGKTRPPRLPARPPSLMLCVLGTVIKAWHASTPSSHCTLSTTACAAQPSIAHRVPSSRAPSVKPPS